MRMEDTNKNKQVIIAGHSRLIFHIIKNGGKKYLAFLILLYKLFTFFHNKCTSIILPLFILHIQILCI